MEKWIKEAGKWLLSKVGTGSTKEGFNPPGLSRYWS